MGSFSTVDHLSQIPSRVTSCLALGTNATSQKGHRGLCLRLARLAENHSILVTLSVYPTCFLDFCIPIRQFSALSSAHRTVMSACFDVMGNSMNPRAAQTVPN